MKYKQPKPCPPDKDWPDEEVGYKELRSFGRRMQGGKKSYKEARGNGAAKRGRKFLSD